jgi:dTDP-glucose 4,6-dehydratase
MSDGVSLLSLPNDDLDRVVNSVGPLWHLMRGQRLLLTGGTGFIGKWMLGTFLHANCKLGLGAEVTVMSRNPEGFKKKFPELTGRSDIQWLKCDVRDLTPQAVGVCQFTIHAATDVVGKSTPAEILDTCISGTRRVLEAVTKENSVHRLLLLSSGAVYGSLPSEIQMVDEGWFGAPETASPSSAYGEGKRVSELLCSIAAASSLGLEVAIARCFAFVGPHLPLDKHFAIGNFIGSAIRSEDIHIQGDGTPLRSYLYASDLAHWLWVMLFKAPSGRAYNVGGDETVSIANLASRVNRVLCGKGEVCIAQEPRLGLQPASYVPSLARISEELGLVPLVNLDDAILRTAAWAMQK